VAESLAWMIAQPSCLPIPQAKRPVGHTVTRAYANAAIVTRAKAP
jgi:hypothetical protein